MQVKEMLQGMCCISLEITEHVGFEHMVPNVIGGEKSRLNQNLNTGPLEYHASTLTSELRRLDILQTFHERMLLCSSDIV